MRKLKDLKLLHSYSLELDEITKRIKNKIEFKQFLIDNNHEKYRFYHPLLMSDGSIIFNLMYGPLVKLDFCGIIEWVNDENLFRNSIMNIDDNIIVPPFCILIQN